MDSPSLARGFALGQPNFLSAGGLFLLFVGENLASNPYQQILYYTLQTHEI